MKENILILGHSDIVICKYFQFGLGNILSFALFFLNDKLLDWPKLITLIDDNLNVAKIISLYNRVENTVGKRENAGYQHFLLFSVFSKAFLFRVIKSLDWMVKGCTIRSVLSNKLLNPLPDNNILDWSKLKQIADNILMHI